MIFCFILIFLFNMAKLIKNKNNKTEISNTKELADIVKQQRDSINKISSDISGTKGYENIDIVSKSVNKIVNNYSKSIGGNILDRIEQNKKVMNNNERLALENVKDMIKNNTTIGSFRSMLSARDSNVAKYEDLMIVTKVMPQLKDVRRFALASVLSPDDFRKQIALSIVYNNQNLETCDIELYEEIKKIINKYELTKVYKHAIDRALTLGKYYYAILPYNKLYADLLIRKEKQNRNNKIIKESKDMTSNSNDKFIQNSTETIINEAVELFDCDKSTIKEHMKELVNNIEIDESGTGVIDLFNTELLSEDVNSKITSVNTQIKNKIGTASDGLLNSNKLKNTDHSNIDLGIPGVKLKKLDPRRVIQLKIDDTVLQYYYIDTQSNYKSLRNPGAFNLKRSISSYQAETGVERIYKSIGDIIYKKMDQKFIKNNLDIKEQLYDILHYTDCINNNIRVILLDPQDVVEFKIGEEGESIFEESLFYARLYMVLLLSTMSAKISRANDIRAYYFTATPTGGVGNTVGNAINTIKRNNKSFYNCTSLARMMSTFNMFDDLFIAKDNDGNKPIEPEIIQGQDIQVDNELMEQLEKISVESTGTPMPLIRSSTEDVEFSRTYTTLNIKFMKMVLDWQIDLNPSISSLLKKILYSEITDETKRIKIDALQISLQSPMNLLLNNASEQISNAKDLAQNIGDVIYGQDPDQKQYDKFMLEVCKMYAPNVPWDEFQKIKERIATETVEVKGSSDEEITDDNEY